MRRLLTGRLAIPVVAAAALATGLCSCGAKGNGMANASASRQGADGPEGPSLQTRREGSSDPSAVSPAAPKEVGAAPKELPAVEVREYKGQNLSSVKDFRENSIKGPQKVDKAKYRLEITGLVAKPLSLTYDEVIGRERFSKVVTLDCVEGWSARILWEGVKVKDLLAQAGYDPKAAVVIFTAYDGYTTSHPLSWTIDKDILLAYRMNGIDVPVERGFPFVLVAEDKWGYKWIKWVTKIEVSNDTAFRGTWESRGYNQNGDVSGPMFAPR
jgi:DMSO/TMAO reductase YedYZ molybdopterin-dependent catalytic subunit